MFVLLSEGSGYRGVISYVGNYHITRLISIMSPNSASSKLYLTERKAIISAQLDLFLNYLWK